MNTSTSFNNNHPLPLIDFGAFLEGTPEEQKRVAAEIDDGFRDIGFIYLLRHGIDPKKVEECFSWSRRFFDLPEETKMLAPHPPGGSHHRGYSGIGVEKVVNGDYDNEAIEALRTVPDVKESYECGNVDDPDQPNIWLPNDQLPGFREAMLDFFDECCRLVHSILDALSIALDLPSKTQLSETHKKNLFQLRLLHYPPIPRRLLEQSEKCRISAHSDFGVLTLLFQDSIGGLEIEDPRQPGKFKAVPPVEGAILVNVADLLERWSNGRWKSTVHRVVAPPRDVQRSKEKGEDVCTARYSIPFFASADRDTVIEALPGCWDQKDNPKKYETVTAEEYVQMRMAALYK